MCAAVPGQSISFGVTEWVWLADRAIELWRLIQDEPFKLRQHESWQFNKTLCAVAKKKMRHTEGKGYRAQ